MKGKESDEYEAYLFWTDGSDFHLELIAAVGYLHGTVPNTFPEGTSRKIVVAEYSLSDGRRFGVEFNITTKSGQSELSVKSDFPKVVCDSGVEKASS